MNYAAIKPMDIANGPGVRVSLFVSGCTHHCKGCFNEVAWDFNYGKPFRNNTIDYILSLMRPGYIKGITILGGEPFEPENQGAIVQLLRAIKNDAELCNKSIWAYSGYTFERIKSHFSEDEIDSKITDEFLSYLDVLVDGPFIEEKKNLMLRFRGSENQRLIDMKKTLFFNKVILWDGE